MHYIRGKNEEGDDACRDNSALTESCLKSQKPFLVFYTKSKDKSCIKMSQKTACTHRHLNA